MANCEIAGGGVPLYLTPNHFLSGAAFRVCIRDAGPPWRLLSWLLHYLWCLPATKQRRQWSACHK